MSNIAFLGGIHGVGKSTICQLICSELKMEYLSASELLQWNGIDTGAQNKTVADIRDTQNRLILSLTTIIQKRKFYLLDGHYCLLNSNNEITRVPTDVFKQINPFSLNIILGDISEVKSKLEKRDRKFYEHEFLERFQKEELARAKELSKSLRVPLNIGTQDDYSELLLLNRVL